MAPTATTEASADATYMKSRTPFPTPPKFASKLQEREFLKFRLAQAFRIFGQSQSNHVYS